MNIVQDNTVISTAATGRRYDIDFLRVFAFMLLILYHVSMLYAEGEGWHVKSAYQTDKLDIPRLLVNQWRMPLLFIISGLAISFIWNKYGGLALAARRSRQLLVPLLFGMAFVVAPQCYYEALGKGLIEPGFLRFMGQYLTFQDFPGEAWAGEEQIHWTWNHLWYLPYLLFYTLLLIPIAKFLDGPGRLLLEGFRRLRGIALLLGPLIPLMLWGNFVFPKFPDITHALIDDGYAHVMYFTFFLIGYLIGRDAGLWSELVRLRKLHLALAAVAFVLLLVQFNFMPEERPLWLEQLGLLGVYANRWLWLLAVLGWGHYLFNRPMKYLPYATEAIFSWYILHQTITVVVGYKLGELAVGPVLEPIVVLIATFGGCFLLHEYVIRRSTLLRPFFGLRKKP